MGKFTLPSVNVTPKYHKPNELTPKQQALLQMSMGLMNVAGDIGGKAAQWGMNANLQNQKAELNKQAMLDTQNIADMNAARNAQMNAKVMADIQALGSGSNPAEAPTPSGITLPAPQSNDIRSSVGTTYTEGAPTDYDEYENLKRVFGNSARRGSYKRTTY